MTTFKGVTHAPGPDGLLSGDSLCGADPATNFGGVLRIQQAAYTCLVCMDIAAKPEPLPLEPCEGTPYPDEMTSVAAAADAGFVSWRQFTCFDGHIHVTDGNFGGGA